MAGGDEILVDEEARGIMLALGKHDPEGPRASEVANVTGPTSSDGTRSYRRTMQDIGRVSQDWFVKYLQIIRRDCTNGVKALDDFTAQDAEIMALLRKYEEEATSAASQFSSPRTTLPGGESPPNPGAVANETPGGADVKSWGKSLGG